mmetsp:Transcript_46708/g.90102  ORF Transcript_46708/g.90102 Transcript_46708/m.90102 type:complete len:173 (+) Transcript_46708:3-521(+)
MSSCKASAGAPTKAALGQLQGQMRSASAMLSTSKKTIVKFESHHKERSVGLFCGQAPQSHQLPRCTEEALSVFVETERTQVSLLANVSIFKKLAWCTSSSFTADFSKTARVRSMDFRYKFAKARVRQAIPCAQSLIAMLAVSQCLVDIPPPWVSKGPNWIEREAETLSNPVL